MSEPIATPSDYRDVFERHPQGIAILADLAMRFHDCPIGVDTEKTHKTAQQLGGRAVVQFILNKIAQTNAPTDEQAAT